jgi:phosphatidylinositol alpha-mannosyltransferase
VLLEAMAAETAIVASDLSGYRLVARPDRDGILVPPGDVDALAAALTTVLGDAARREQLVASGIARAAEFSMDRLADAYVALYEQVTTAAPQARGWRRLRSRGHL